MRRDDEIPDEKKFAVPGACSWCGTAVANQKRASQVLDLVCKLYHTGAAFRLYHTQSESFVNASCDAEKDRRYAHAGRDPRKNQQYAHGDATREGVPRAGGDPAHIPYLKTLPDHGDDPDPT